MRIESPLPVEFTAMMKLFEVASEKSETIKAAT
jgi:hypothetical protein